MTDTMPPNHALEAAARKMVEAVECGLLTPAIVDEVRQALSPLVERREQLSRNPGQLDGSTSPPPVSPSEREGASGIDPDDLRELHEAVDSADARGDNSAILYKEVLRRILGVLSVPDARSQSMPLVGGEDAYDTIVRVLDSFHDGQREKKARAILSALQAFNPDADLSSLRQDAVAPGGDGDAWRPIESAPKDGTPILAFCVHPNARYAGEDAAEWAEIVVTRWIDFNGGGWTWNGICGVHTHWMPLPAPPADVDPSRQSGEG
jgi:hypothetical protein